jgi:hypothetical protein
LILLDIFDGFANYILHGIHQNKAMWTSGDMLANTATRVYSQESRMAAARRSRKQSATRNERRSKAEILARVAPTAPGAMWLRAPEVCLRLNCHPRTLMRAVAEHRFPAPKRPFGPGSLPLWPLDEILDHERKVRGGA